MLDEQELHTVAQLIDNIEIILGKLEESYSSRDSEEFNKSKNEILNSQIKIADIIKWVMK